MEGLKPLTRLQRNNALGYKRPMRCRNEAGTRDELIDFFKRGRTRRSNANPRPTIATLPEHYQKKPERQLVQDALRAYQNGWDAADHEIAHKVHRIQSAPTSDMVG